METSSNALRTSYAPTETADLYPESDGKPMAETDLHIEAIFRMRLIFRGYYTDTPDVYISGNLMMYYEDTRPPKAVSPDLLISFGVGKKPRRTRYGKKENRLTLWSSFQVKVPFKTT